MCFTKVPNHKIVPLEIDHTVEIHKDPAGFSSVNNFLIEGKIAHHVKKVVDLDNGEEYAMKVFNGKTGHDGFEREVNVVELLPPHDNIIHFVRAIDDPYHASKQFIVMEMAEGGQITNVDPKTGQCDRTFPSDHSALLIRQVTEGIAHMHAHNVLHRDLKPENVLLDKSLRTAKLADFGESVALPIYGGSDLVTGPGSSVAYSCPESFTCETYHGKPADVWGIGVVAYCVLFGHLPFWSPSHSQIMDCILTSPLQIPAHATPSERHFISNVLHKDPTKRLTISQILSHPWVKSSAPPTPASTPRLLPSFLFSPAGSAASTPSGSRAGSLQSSVADFFHHSHHHSKSPTVTLPQLTF